MIHLYGQCSIVVCNHKHPEPNTNLQTIQRVFLCVRSDMCLCVYTFYSPAAAQKHAEPRVQQVQQERLQSNSVRPTGSRASNPVCTCVPTNKPPRGKFNELCDERPIMQSLQRSGRRLRATRTHCVLV